MRISTGMQYRTQLNYLQKANSIVDAASRRYNTGQKFQTAGEDPSGMSQKIRYTADIAAYQQYGVNAGIVADSLSQEETALGQIWDSLASANSRLIQAVNGTMDDGSRAALAKDLEQLQAQLYDLMNTKDSQGNYIFSGAQSSKPTYVKTSSGRYDCQADGAVKWVQVSPTIKVQTSDSGFDIFENVQTAKGFTATGNASSKYITAVKDYDQFNTFYNDHYSATDPNKNKFTVEIDHGKGVFQLKDSAGNIIDGGEIKDGAIEVMGMKFTLQDGQTGGSPDSFNINLNDPEQENILNGLTDIINQLNVPKDEWDKQNPPMTSDTLTQAIAAMQQHVNNSMDQVDKFRGLVGARGANIDAIIKSDETLSDIKSEARANISEVDAFTAVSDLLISQNALQVAQQTYQRVHSTSLFDFI